MLQNQGTPLFRTVHHWYQDTITFWGQYTTGTHFSGQYTTGTRTPSILGGTTPSLFGAVHHWYPLFRTVHVPTFQDSTPLVPTFQDSTPLVPGHHHFFGAVHQDTIIFQDSTPLVPGHRHFFGAVHHRYQDTITFSGQYTTGTGTPSL